MPMLSPQERSDLRTSRVMKYYEMERQYELVTYFYPARRLTIWVSQIDIKAIMNCDTKEAVALLRKIGKKEGNESCPQLRTSVFCHHMGIDEMLIQLFLASLDSFGEPYPPKKRLPALTREEIAAERPRQVYQLSELLQDGIMENTKTLALRAKIWEEANPDGEPMYKRKKFVLMVIRALEVAQIYGCHLNTAQEMLREVRDKEREIYPNSKLRRYVSIKKFCAVHNEDEENLRKHLAELHGDDDDDDDEDDD
jgi:hypothetical protein